ncbi:MAG TPA: cobalamin-independent methionine synthase II family protein [Candidatus Eisenbacteria bacterium]|nr:cobalamin-independent methionine synthase II family protein [Candidatus Eisenbacteria bacterium]
MNQQAVKSCARLRTDVVGSLLRPAHLKEAYAQRDEGKITEDELRRIQDEAIRQAVRLQEGAGLDVVTDGEFRRLNFQDSFAASVSGFDARRADFAFVESLVRGGRPLQRWDPYRVADGAAILQRRPVSQKLRLMRNLPLEEFRFVSQLTRKPAKVSLIGPDRIVQRFDYHNSKSVYWSVEDFIADVVRIEREMIRGLIDAGCRYVQIDAPSYTAYVDAPSLAEMRARGEDPTKNLGRSIQADNEILRLFDDVTFGIHLCRGNQRSMWHREGSYDAIAEQLFTELRHDRFLLEYDSPRAGTFEPLRFVPRNKIVVLGLVSTKVPELEKIDDLRRRIDQAANYIPLDQLAISPQCGFASDVVGNLISEDDQKRKLEVVVETARRVWG